MPHSTAPQFVRPYKPSWLDRFIDWIDARPGPAWLYYLAWIFIMGAIVVVTSWMVGVTAMGRIEARSFLYGVYPVYFVALMHYLDGQAKSALAKFRPALKMNDLEYQQLEYGLTTVPARGAWIGTIVALPLGFLVAMSDHEDPLVRSGQTLGLLVAAVPTMFAMACLVIFAYHTIRQLGMVSRIHALATAINPFHAGPAYAFSQLTARTGIGLIFFAYFIILLAAPDPSDLFTYILIFAIIAVAVAAFILPLYGMHQRLVREKAELETKINDDVEVAYQELDARVQARNFAGVEDLDKVITSLLSLREVVAKLSTWPWQAETLRGFISALLVPILIWILTTILERFITF